MVMVLGVTGCDDDRCHDCRQSPVVVETVCCDGGPVQLPYRLEVAVRDTAGYWLGGATVEVIVATVPEQRFVLTTRSDGVATLFLEAPAGATIVVYTCAPGYRCRAADVLTSPSHPDLALVVTLSG
ncbi:MAG TPA: hypothetical protein PKC67_03375 [Kiritimatiellia bacterium]|nr:hypothetical protein [Kiritimatiellia bacterium]HMP33368.1 hypothetical protein [Kiritimatiellia bacterium]